MLADERAFYIGQQFLLFRRFPSSAPGLVDYYDGNKTSNKIDTTIRDTADIITNSGLTLIPNVSSSKNLSKPALDAGICPSDFFFLELIRQHVLRLLI